MLAWKTIDLYKRKTTVDGFREIVLNFIVAGAPLQVNLSGPQVGATGCICCPGSLCVPVRARARSRRGVAVSPPCVVA